MKVKITMLKQPSYLLFYSMVLSFCFFKNIDVCAKEETHLVSNTGDAKVNLEEISKKSVKKDKIKKKDKKPEADKSDEKGSDSQPKESQKESLISDDKKDHSDEAKDKEGMKYDDDAKKSDAHDKNIEKSSSSSSPSINITVYRNGLTLATKKIKADLKTGRQSVIYDKVPKTLNVPSLIASLDAADTHVQVLGQSLSDDTQDLILDVISGYDQVKILTLNYLFSGLDWEVFYTGILSPDQKLLTLHGWIEISNHTGMTLADAQILFDGSVAKITPDGTTLMHTDKSDFEYLLPRLITLPEGKKTYISFINALPIDLTQDNIINVGEDSLNDLKGDNLDIPVQRVLQFKNSEKIGINFTLPEGKMTLYQIQHSGLNHYIGTIPLAEAPIGENVFLQVGSDLQRSVTCELEQTDYKKSSSKSSESGYNLHIVNKSDHHLQMKVIVPTAHYDWTMIRSTPNHSVSGANSHQDVIWEIELPEGESRDVKYRLKLSSKR